MNLDRGDEEPWEYDVSMVARPAEPDAGEGEGLDVLLSDFYHSDVGDYVSALGDIHRWLAAHDAKAKAEALDAVLAEADEGIEFGPANMILLRRVVNRAARSTR
jgi:hypothetical protein